ncbi:MAG: RNA ligase RtcB family protein, partial [Sphingobacteriaceae bacterium]
LYISCGETYNGPANDWCQAEVKIIGERSEIESSAIEELHTLSKLPGIVKILGMPDLHSGPTGCVIATLDCIYPRFVGSDAGCGMSVFMAGKKSRFNSLRFQKSIDEIESLSAHEIASLKQKCNIWDTAYDKDLGTIGGSNHFAEYQCIDTVMDSELCRELQIHKDMLLLTVHSGSRGLGKSISDAYRNICLKDESEITRYMSSHDHAVRWGQANRLGIASRILRTSTDQIVPLIDICHNQVVKLSNVYYHRKGAAPADDGYVILPGSRGSHSYIVKPKASLTYDNLRDIGFSIAHGAGRRLTRTKAEAKALKLCKGNYDSLLTTALNSVVSCLDKKVLCQEIPEAYKNIDDVILDLAPYVSVVAKLMPVLTIKSLPDNSL